MADVFTKRKRSQVMAAIRSKGNKATELKLISIFRCNGIKGWRRHQPLPGKPDFIFQPERVAVFVDGCFWHGCRRHLRMPVAHRVYWQNKISLNRKRDKKSNRVLNAQGWKVVRVWQHELRDEARLVERIRSKLGARKLKKKV
jgi:DNA mismatch endonuclease (patch repair protein)